MKRELIRQNEIRKNYTILSSTVSYAITSMNFIFIVSSTSLFPVEYASPFSQSTTTPLEPDAG